MKNGNALLDEFVGTVSQTPPGQRINAPWTKYSLDDEQQAAAATLIRYGIIGMSDKGTLYLGRNRVGNPFLGLINGWLIYPLTLIYLWLTMSVAQSHEVYSTWAGFALAATGVVYFGSHFFTSVRFAMLFVRGLKRRGEMVKLGSQVIGLTTCVGILIGLAYWRIF